MSVFLAFEHSGTQGQISFLRRTPPFASPLNSCHKRSIMSGLLLPCFKLGYRFLSKHADRNLTLKLYLRLMVGIQRKLTYIIYDELFRISQRTQRVSIRNTNQLIFHMKIVVCTVRNIRRI